jgi:AraC-like DNA-binding protein
VVTLCLSEAVRCTIAAGLDSSVRIEECCRESELIERLKRSHAAVGVRELATDVRAGKETSRALRRMVEAMPDVRLLVVCTPGRYTMAAARAAWRAGVQTVALHPYNDITLAVRRAFGRRRFDRAERRLLTPLTSVLSERACRIIRCCLRRAYRQPTVERLANVLRISGRTFERRCREEGLPLPEELITRCRLLMAVEIARSSHASLDRTSKRFGFHGAADLRTKLKRHTGLTVRQARVLDDPRSLLFHGLRSEIAATCVDRPIDPAVVVESGRKPTPGL